MSHVINGFSHAATICEMYTKDVIETMHQNGKKTPLTPTQHCFVKIHIDASLHDRWIDIDGILDHKCINYKNINQFQVE